MGAIVLQQAIAASPSWMEHVSDLLRTAFALGAVCLLAWFALRFVASRGLGKRASGSKLEVIERLALDTQRSVVLLRVDRRRLLIGLGAGAPRLITELDAEARLLEEFTSAVQDGSATIVAAQKSDATH